MQTSRTFLLSSLLVFFGPKIYCQRDPADSLKMIINEMAANGVYERSMTVGYTGCSSRQLQLYKKLLTQASEKELMELAGKHENAAVRLYAFQALKMRAKVIPNSLVTRFKTDIVEIVTLTGCLANKKPVKSLAFESII